MALVWADCRNPWNKRHNISGLFRLVADFVTGVDIGLRVVTRERNFADQTQRNEGMFGPQKAHASRLVVHRQLMDMFREPTAPAKWSLSLTWRWYDLYHYVDDTPVPYLARVRGDRTQRQFMAENLSTDVMLRIVNDWNQGRDVHAIRELWLQNGDKTEHGRQAFVNLFFGSSEDLSSKPLGPGGGPS